MVHIVGNGPTFENTDVRGDEGAVQPVWDQVAVAHARPPDAPGIVARAMAHDQALRCRGHPHRWIGRHKMHPQTIGRDQQGYTRCGRRLTQQVDVGSATGRALYQSQALAMRAHHGGGRTVGWKDRIQSKAKLFLKEMQGGRQVTTSHQDLCRADTSMCQMGWSERNLSHGTDLRKEQAASLAGGQQRRLSIPLQLRPG